MPLLQPTSEQYVRLVLESSQFSFTFTQDDDSAANAAGKPLRQTVRPQHLDGVKLLSIPESEVNARIVAGCEASPRIAPPRLLATGREDTNRRIIAVTPAK
jgi:hypothetical protein